MGSFGLPALDIKPPTPQPNPVEQYGQLMQLKNAVQNAPLQHQALQNQVQEGQNTLQQQQQGLKDQQAMTAAMQGWDGKDLNQLAPLAIKNGASASAVMGLKSKILEQQQSYSKIAADDATTGSKNLETTKGKNDLVVGALTSVQALPDEQLAQGLTQTANDLGQRGLVDPAHVQSALKIAQSGDPVAIRQQLSIIEKGLMGQSSQIETALKAAQTHESDSIAAKNNTENAFYSGGGTGAPGVPLANVATKIYAIDPQNRTADQNAFIKGYEKNNDVTKIQPSMARMQVLMQMPQAVADPNNPGQTVFTTRKGAIGMEAPNSGDVKSVQATQKFFSPAGKGGQNLAAFNTAQNHLQLLSQASEALGNGNIPLFNQLSQGYAKATGSEVPTNFDAIKNALKGEVSKALTGNVTVSEQAALDKDFTNASSPKQLIGVAKTYTQLMQGKKDVLHQQYTDGMNGKVSFDDAQPSSSDPFAQFGGKAH